MLLELSVENIAIIEKCHVRLEAGLTALTGETGAGKSLLIDAIELALGVRADADLVREGSTKGSVHVVIDLSDAPEIVAECALLGVETEEGLVTIQREVSVEGRSLARVNGRIVPNSTLKALGALLVDLHGQHDHQALLNPLTHGRFFDSWIGPPALQVIDDAARSFARLRASQEQLSSLNRGVRESEQRRDMLTFQAKEIEEACLREGELESLEVQLTRLAYRAKLESALASVVSDLDSGEWNVRDRLAQALKTIHAAASLDPSLLEATSLLESAQIQLEEGWAKVREYASVLEYSEDSLEVVAARIDKIKMLLRKYGETEADTLAYCEKIRAELGDTEDVEDLRARLEGEIEAASVELQKNCDVLSAVRQQHAPGFASGIEAQLRELAMADPKFEVRLIPKLSVADGQETIEFHFSANAGEAPRSLARIASGGEISRLMLALKTLLAGKAGVPTLIFDEVDTGLSGRTAAVMARKLEELAQYHQILVITHLPQIASRASRHFRIEKVLAGDRTVTQITLLADEERVHEIARLLAGEQITATSLANATELLAR